MSTFTSRSYFQIAVLLALSLIVTVSSTSVGSLSVDRLERAQLLGSSGRAPCSEDYLPCRCDLTSNGIEVFCIDVSVAQITDVFFRTRALDLFSVTLTMSVPSTPGLITLPRDLLSNKRTKNLLLWCPTQASPKIQLAVENSTFQFTRTETLLFEIDHCDLAQQARFDFLYDFAALTTLRVQNSNNVGAISTMPSLPLLQELVISGNTGLDSTTFPNLNPARLLRIYLDNSNLDDAGVTSILTSVAASASASSLQRLSLAGNQLTQVPLQVPSFSDLTWLSLASNAIEAIQVSRLTFSSQVELVNLRGNPVRDIADGAFVGNFGKASIDLARNNLDVFERGVFFNTLTQMVAGGTGGGSIDIAENPFTCNCTLGWLIYHHRELLPSVDNGVCGGFFTFETLSPDSFKDCPDQRQLLF